MSTICSIAVQKWDGEIFQERQKNYIPRSDFCLLTPDPQKTYREDVLAHSTHQCGAEKEFEEAMQAYINKTHLEGGLQALVVHQRRNRANLLSTSRCLSL